jgi:hypothetical protein
VIPQINKKTYTAFSLAALILLIATAAPAQESSSKSGFGGPASALRDALAAACSQDQTSFAHALTARNQETFARMATVTRIALMKRFVLLNEPGKSTVSANPQGRPLVHCQTPSVTTEMQIGGTEFRDNIAFLLLELRDATDSTGESAHQITLGLVRENGEWKLLSLGLLLLDLPALEIEWDAADISSNEKDALESIKEIAHAVEAFRVKYARLPNSLSNLGLSPKGPGNADAAGLLESDLANGMKNGYSFRFVLASASNLGAPARYELAATPLQYGRTGKKSFFRDSNGGIHAADHKGGVGSDSDPKAE